MATPFGPTAVPFGRVVDRVVRPGEEPGFDTGDLLLLPDSVRAFHVAIFGRTGVGKSRFMDSLIQADIERGAPFILIDGVGASYDDAVSALATRLLTMHIEERRAPPALRRWMRRRIERFFRRFAFVDFTAADPLWRWNPVAVPPQLRPWEAVAAMIGACVRATETDPEQTRQLLQVIRAVLTVLVELPGTVLRDALDALALGDDWESLLGFLERQHAAARGGQPAREPAALKFLRDYFVHLPPRDRDAIARSTWNMINIFLGDPVVAKFFSSTDSTLDLPAHANGEKCLLVRLPPGLDVLTQRLLGSLLLDLIMLFASKRDLQAVATGKLPRVTLYIDEVATFAGKSFTQDLTRCRNWGIAVVAAAQNWRQSPWHTVEGQALYQAMRGNMGTTVLFRVPLDMALAEAESIRKPRGDQLSRVEMEVTETIGASEGYGLNTSSSSSTTSSSTASEGRAEGSALSDGTSSNWDRLGSNGMSGSTSFGNSRSDSRQSSTSHGLSDSRGRTDGESYQRSTSTSRSEKLRRDYYSIDDETRIFAQEIAGLAAREFYAVLGNDRAEAYRVRTLDVPVEWDTVWGGIDFREELLAIAAPPLAAPEPAEGLEVRVRRLLQEERRRNHDPRFGRPRIVAGGRK